MAQPFDRVRTSTKRMEKMCVCQRLGCHNQLPGAPLRVRDLIQPAICQITPSTSIRIRLGRYLMDQAFDKG
jgi:hypothetical protein